MLTAGGTAPIRVSARDVLRDPDFATYMVAAIISNAGSFMQSVSVPFVLFEITHSNSWVGVGSFAALVPSLVVTPWAGTVTDRFDRRIVLLWSNLVQLISALGLVALAMGQGLTPPRMVALVVLGGLGAGFQYAPAQSMAASLLPPEQLLHGVRLIAVGFTLSRAAGPAVAGLVLGLWGPKATFGINALSFVIFIVALLVIQVRPVERIPSGLPWAEQFRSGFHYVMSRPALRLVVISALFAGFLGQSMVQLAAGLAKDDFHVSAAGFSLLPAVYGGGAVIASIVLVVGADRLRRSLTTVLGLALFVVGITVAVATTHFLVGLAGFAIAGLAHALTGTSLNTSMQAQVDEEYRGRSLSMFLMALLIGMPFGALLGGWLGDRIGLRLALLGYACMLALYLLVALTRLDRLRRLDGSLP